MPNKEKENNESKKKRSAKKDSKKEDNKKKEDAKSESAKSKSSHEGHRARVKEKFIQTDGNGFRAHELLELVLFYAVPRGDTNAIAHRLLEYFGSLDHILEASIEQLVLIEGMGESSAVLLKSILLLSKEYYAGNKIIRKRLKNEDDMVNFGRHYAYGAQNELFFVVCLDPTLNIIDTKLIANGTINEAKPIIRTVLEFCLYKRACYAVVYHNHPDGDAEPSPADKEITKLLYRELDLIGVSLREHIILGKRDYFRLLSYLDKHDIGPMEARIIAKYDFKF